MRTGLIFWLSGRAVPLQRSLRVQIIDPEKRSRASLGLVNAACGFPGFLPIIFRAAYLTETPNKQLLRQHEMQSLGRS